MKQAFPCPKITVFDNKWRSKTLSSHLQSIGKNDLSTQIQQIQVHKEICAVIIYPRPSWPDDKLDAQKFSLLQIYIYKLYGGERISQENYGSQ